MTTLWRSQNELVLVDCSNHRSSVLIRLDLLRLKWCSEPSVHGGKEDGAGGVSEAVDY